MSLRGRLALGSGVVVAVASTVSACVVYVTTRATLLTQVDASLRDRVEAVTATAPSHVAIDVTVTASQAADPTPVMENAKTIPIEVPPPPLGAAGGYTQYVFDGLEPDQVTTDRAAGSVIAPTAEDQAVARRTRASYLSNRTVNGTHVRVLTVPVAPGTAALIVRPLGEVDSALYQLLWILAAVIGGASLTGAALGRLFAARVIAPIRKLSNAAKHVEKTADLSKRMDIDGSDELASLGRSFNTMLDSLERSQATQRDLIADASHELRTPLTSLRTYLDILAAHKRLSIADSGQLLGDARAQAEELTGLIADVVTLAHGDSAPTARTTVHLDTLTRKVVERAERRDRRCRFVLTTTPSVVQGDPEALERAISNMIDNAMKWSPPGEPIEVIVEDGSIRVSDNGHGFDPLDLPRAFDRFYRGASARAKPGSGLGLAIVRQVAHRHGGEARVANRRSGGAIVELKIPPRPPDT